jgi:sulfopyruvate decarboxylase TPP-binding subunit
MSVGVVEGRVTAGLSGESIIQQIKASGVEFVVSVPDITTSEGLLRPLAKLRSPRLIRICKEDEGVGICAGLAYTGKRALLLIQQTGLLEKEPDVRPRQSKRYGVRIVEPILDAMGIAYHEIEGEEDVPKIRPAIDEAYAKSQPVVLLIGRRPQA